tara:strand:+ start:308 stop:478 length:171 start_codon:yes stop_codon:yes gene_type:complete
MSIVRCEACDRNIDLDFDDASYEEVFSVWICSACDERFEKSRKREIAKLHVQKDAP